MGGGGYSKFSGAHSVLTMKQLASLEKPGESEKDAHCMNVKGKSEQKKGKLASLLQGV